MGFMDIFKKKKSCLNTRIVFSEHTPSPSEISHQGKLDALRKTKNAMKDSAGLYPHEILLLSYYKKYAAGKPIARFWQYEFGIDNVPALMKSLQARGFANENDLTPLGEEEVNKSEYITYIRRHKNFGISLTDLSILVNNNPNANYRDLIWGELNKKSIEYAKNRKWGLYRNERYSMYIMLKEEKRYLQALNLLFEVVFYDMNSGDVYPIPPGIIDDIRELSIRLDIPNEKMIEILQKECKSIYNPTNNFSNDQTVLVFVAYAYGQDKLAENVLKKKK